MLGGTGHALVAMDFRELPASGPIASWWNRDIKDSNGRILNPVESFDALVFFPTATPWRL